MKLDSLLKSSLSAWKEILIGFVSTVLGIAVTIGVDKKLEDDQAEEDKRNLTIMIIHDLDESEQQMQKLLDFYREYYDKAEYVSEHIDRIAEMSEDTLYDALKFLSIDMEANRLKYAQMAENVLTTNMNNWTTLSNVKFMTNAERCFAYRKMFNESSVDKDYSEPIKKRNLEFHNRYLHGIDVEGVRKIVAEFYKTEETLRYISYFKLILDQQSAYVSSLHQLNSENKWLMSVSNDDIEEYIKASSKRAPVERPRVTKESVVGTWQMDIDYEKGVRRFIKSQSLTIYPDNTYKIVRKADAYETSADTAYTHIETAYGHWQLEDGNNILRIFDSIQMAPAARYAGDETIVGYLAESKAEIEKDTTSSRTVMSDILISETEMSFMEYTEGEEDKAYLAHYRRK